ncbi:unnamed protein product [Amoebophrya sp. A25]|nr:unnamed protein product [Amoebophrya sp. A25]|eukprot:GSA25T00024069001.1
MSGKSSSSSGSKKLAYSDNAVGRRTRGEAVSGRQWKRIADVNELYKIGSSLLQDLPDDNKFTKVAVRRKDGQEVVVKGRHKVRGFKDDEEMSDWRESMALMFYVSGGRDQEKKNFKSRMRNVAAVFDLLEDGEWIYSVMERVKGRDMFDYFVQEKLGKKGGQDVLAIARNFTSQIAGALLDLHSVGICHRDLKFENIVVDENGQRRGGDAGDIVIKVIDFDTCEVWTPGRITYHVMGTDQYIAPEVYAGSVTPACDVWALGVMLYTIFTGTLPFHRGRKLRGPPKNGAD